MNPTLAARNFARWERPNALVETPSISTAPEVGRSSPATHSMSVDLPEPDAPTIAVNDPRPSVRLAPSTARTRSRRPGTLNSRVSSSTRTATSSVMASLHRAPARHTLAPHTEQGWT